MIKIRRPAVLFALLSAMYWVLVKDLWSGVTFLHYPYWQVVLAGTLPAMLYALVALWFCGWLARRVVRQVTALRSETPPESDEA